MIARNNEPVVRLVPIAQEKPRREFGALRGKLVVPDEFFDPLPDDELEAWDQ